nr:prepilin-type N-terminal cleavage/methylation domain-containing protein [Macrococcus sp. 19Msa1099]QYA38732.1 prepilin-type N-terminal cleavage/methylation domain-containing protein [Macrococcus caseolyticus]QYA77439.1 prepilin-type N-terminal cleavage/methylation domain-containing protein [Macrococcus caseolyticus]
MVKRIASRLKKQFSKNEGFTLIEMIIV